MIEYEYTEGPTGCLDDGNALSRALRQIPKERLDQILKEELPQTLNPAQQKERNVSPECWREKHEDCECSFLICRCACHRVTSVDVEQILEQLKHNPQVCVCKPFCVHWEVWAMKVLSAALKAERERAAGIAELMRPSGGRTWTDEQHACFDALSECAKNIRTEEGK